MNKRLAHPQNAVMADILASRYTNLKKEYTLCQNLLEWAKQQKDDYAKAFALTYLGDYFIAQNSSAQAAPYLTQAQTLLEAGSGDDELQLRVFCLLALCYELSADDQNSTRYYLEAIAVAKRLGDKQTEAVISNNMGFAFTRHHCNVEALTYYKKAYQLLQGQAEDTPIRPTLLFNMATLLLQLGKTREAKQHLEECDLIKEGPDNQTVHKKRNWCLYYAALGDTSTAIKLAGEVLAAAEQLEANRLAAFDNYNALCEAMLAIDNREYAGRFLDKMSSYGEKGGLDQHWILEQRRMEFCLKFEQAPRRAEAFRRYYLHSKKLKTLQNQTIVHAMQASIQLDKALSQQADLSLKKTNLERQANLDELTQLYNRRFMEKQLRARTGGHLPGSFCIIMLDIDYFKEYNDCYGHLEGDKVLEAVGACLKENVQTGITPCRYGGDEFACLCTGLSEEALIAYIQAVQASLAALAIPHIKSHCAKLVTLSIGYAFLPKGRSENPHIMLQLADQALYQTKSAGRNHYTGKRVAI